MRTCTRCGRGIEDDFRFCPGCGAAQRSKLVEYFPGDAEHGDGGLRVSAYLDPPRHVRFSIWTGERADAALSLDPAEADRLSRFLLGLRRTRRSEFASGLRRDLKALADAVADAVARQ